MAYTAQKSHMIRLARVWATPLWLVVRTSKEADVVRQDVDRWIECIGNDALRSLDLFSRFAYLAGALTEFRNVVHFRLRSSPLPIRLLARLCYRPERSLVIEAESIGPGLFVHHGTGTIIHARSIGSNFWVNQHASVGFSAKGIPTIGNNVRVAAGAVVAGPIDIGDNVVIGANAVVVKDVPAGTVMAAPLARPLGK
ncbi:serine acetyltransferase [Rhodococcus sp. 06-412-2C]|uniref:serine acetyltransferase n=1 Tax=unclassified Rhodococcus (in: high G+C Gram-positive bacteria) TaxID=192944 RepID=UPI000B9ACC34|nr:MULTISPECIES: serine acetyltransferase [unclassified Rhodococcus (in: high G+C Gram-positive bacteria)]OZC83654.1 serine acetyltransferase [Rhodococcus sp. 06-412-2C]OZC93841.1 serine acetyltransferase [Rhodococcus sp. 06-412-2B]